MMEAESKFPALLIRISKLLSRRNVEELAFITSKDINDRQLSEETAESGNALKLFQAMCDRGLYTHNNPSLLLQHLKDIDRSDAARMLQQEIGASSLNFHMNEIIHPKVEVELLRGRPPPIPERPPQRPKIANYGVQELELCRLSRRFSAGKVDDLGLELGFGDGRISQLKYENPHDISRVFYRLMVDWRSAQHGGSNMRENLVKHLRNIDCMELAGDLEMGRFS